MEQRETEYLLEVQSFIDREIERLNGLQQAEMIQARERGKDFSLSNPYGSVYGQAYELQEEIGKKMENVNRCRADADFLVHMRSNPYFGRVDFVEDGYPEDSFYVGLRTLTDSEEYRVLVYDWRTPVCSLFYAGEIGRAWYTAPMGKIEGTITRIRQYAFKNGKLASWWDADLRIDDAVLRSVLGGASSERLKVIVCSIQREQNRAIRYDTAKSLAVFGPAGCGKTSIGMHRLAWLLYEMRSSMISRDILLFTNNAAFLSYVSGVLPDLGEEEVRSALFTSLFDQWLPNYRIRDYYEQAEAILNGDEQRKKQIAAVYDPAFIAYLDNCLDSVSCRFRDVCLFGNVILPAESVYAKYAAFSPSLTVRARLELVGNWVKEEIEDYFLVNRISIQAKINETCDIYESTKKLFDALREGLIGNALQMVGSAVAADTVPLYYRFFKQWSRDGEAVKALGRRMGSGELYFEDALAALYIAAKLGACVPDPMPLHILLDEAQDYCVLQHKIFRLIYPKAVFTVLADVRQAVVPQLNTCSEADIAAIYGAHTMYLGKSYRSTRQISEFAKTFCDDPDYETFDRDGAPPFLYHTDQAAAQTARIIRQIPEEYNSVCVLTRTAAQTKQFGRELAAEGVDCRVIADASRHLDGRITVMPVTLSKGLEFDAVIIPEAEKLEDDRRIAYMMTTRALHELHLIYREENGNGDL